MNTSVKVQNSTTTLSYYYASGKKAETGKFKLQVNETEMETDSSETSSAYSSSDKIYKQINCNNHKLFQDVNNSKNEETKMKNTVSQVSERSNKDKVKIDTVGIDKTDLLLAIRDKIEEMQKKIENGEIEEKIQIGGAAYTIKEWDKLLEKFDTAQEIIKNGIKDEIEKKMKDEMEKKIENEIEDRYQNEKDDSEKEEKIKDEIEEL